MRPLRPATLPAVASVGLVIMLVAIGTAWAFQIGGGYVPCALCLEQRIPYYLGIPLALLGIVIVRVVPVGGRLLLLAAALAMVWAAGLGIYHAGTEWGFFEGPNTCGTGGGPVTDTQTLLDDLAGKVFVSCNTAAGRFLGLSFAGWNVVAATLAALTLLASQRFPPRPAAQGHPA